MHNGPKRVKIVESIALMHAMAREKQSPTELVVQDSSLPPILPPHLTQMPTKKNLGQHKCWQKPSLTPLPKESLEGRYCKAAYFFFPPFCWPPPFCDLGLALGSSALPAILAAAPTSLSSPMSANLFLNLHAATGKEDSERAGLPLISVKNTRYFFSDCGW